VEKIEKKITWMTRKVQIITHLPTEEEERRKKKKKKTTKKKTKKIFKKKKISKLKEIGNETKRNQR